MEEKNATKNRLNLEFKKCRKLYKDRINQLLESIYRKVQEWRSKNTMQNGKFIFQSLAPQAIEPLDKAYVEALDFALNTNDILNIGITGIFGAGKSSVWKSYIKKNNKLKVITVSLGNYGTTDKDTNSNDTLHERVEKQIINQMVAQIDFNKVPLSKFFVKRNKKWYNVLGNIVQTLCMILPFLLILFKEKIQQFEEFQFFYKNIYVLCVTYVCFGISTFLVLWRFFKENKLKLTKIGFSGMNPNLEVGEMIDESSFEKDMQELVYIIRNSGAKIVVFEDLDRFQNVEIFSKLRELNFLVNAGITGKRWKPIKFIYMLKDGMFIKDNRTKFFDFILPIVPVLDSNNSKSELLKMIRSIDLSMKRENYNCQESDIQQDTGGNKSKENLTTFEKKLLKISIYIDDMRMLKNIMNEYSIYYNLVPMKELNLEEEKLFAMIVLKNLIPSEFDALQKEKGFIITLFEKLKANKKEKIQNIIYNQGENSLEEKELYLKSVKDIFNDLEERERKELLEEIRNSINNNADAKIDEKESDFVVFLVAEGLIDEAYNHYKGYFRDGCLGINDTLFLKNIVEKKEQDVFLEIENPELVLEYLEESDFHRFNILNSELMYYLIKEGNVQMPEINGVYSRYDKLIYYSVISALKNNKIEKLNEIFIRKKYSTNELNYILDMILKFDNLEKDELLLKLVRLRNSALKNEHLYKVLEDDGVNDNVKKQIVLYKIEQKEDWDLLQNYFSKVYFLKDWSNSEKTISKESYKGGYYIDIMRNEIAEKLEEFKYIMSLDDGSYMVNTKNKLV